eukprot:4135423-Pyramimonas_sp.AAC.1
MTIDIPGGAVDHDEVYAQWEDGSRRVVPGMTVGKWRTLQAEQKSRMPGRWSGTDQNGHKILVEQFHRTQRNERIRFLAVFSVNPVDKKKSMFVQLMCLAHYGEAADSLLERIARGRADGSIDKDKAEQIKQEFMRANCVGQAMKRPAAAMKRPASSDEKSSPKETKQKK